ncbi:UNVERIFIED_ORG: hypothetical protein ABIC97_003444 [Peribacillus simplex]
MDFGWDNKEVYIGTKRKRGLGKKGFCFGIKGSLGEFFILIHHKVKFSHGFSRNITIGYISFQFS